MASFTVPCPKSSALPLFKGSPHQTQQQFPRISFQSRNAYSPSSSYVDNQNALFRFQGPMQTQPTIWKVHSQLSDVAEKSSNSAPVIEANLGNSSSGGKDEPQEGSVAQNRVPDAVSISAFMTQVADLVKLVDSRDIVELQLKQLDCEVTIRKKEALPQASTPAPVVMMQPHQYQAAPSYPPPAAPSAAPTSASPAPSAAALPAPGKTSSSSHPPLKCPMAGTFYRCAAPGEPPFVKVGDKVQKGQVVCIIEAMKLMNEIEADQSGTVVEILVEDGKAVSVDMPLFVIEP